MKQSAFPLVLLRTPAKKVRESHAAMGIISTTGILFKTNVPVGAMIGIRNLRHCRRH